MGTPTPTLPRIAGEGGTRAIGAGGRGIHAPGPGS